MNVLHKFLWIALVLALSGCARHPVQKVAPRPEGPMVVIDAGHGGKDDGCSDQVEDIDEKELTLKAAARLECYLHQRGYRVFMTRQQDHFVSLDERVALANDVESDLFISIHFNAAENPKAKGIEVFYHDDQSSRAVLSKELAKDVLDQVILATHRKSRGVKTANFRVIRNTRMPAILVEGGFLTNPEESAICQNEEYINSLAYGIAMGVENFCKKSSPARVERATCCLGGNRSIR